MPDIPVIGLTGTTTRNPDEDKSEDENEIHNHFAQTNPKRILSKTSFCATDHQLHVFNVTHVMCCIFYTVYLGLCGWPVIANDSI